MALGRHVSYHPTIERRPRVQDTMASSEKSGLLLLLQRRSDNKSIHPLQLPSVNLPSFLPNIVVAWSLFSIC
jgi:hypothetical protein